MRMCVVFIYHFSIFLMIVSFLAALGKRVATRGTSPHLHLLHHRVIYIPNMPYYCCEWRLDEQQSVKVSNKSRVAFRHAAQKQNVYRGVSLSPPQFMKFCECLRIMDRYDPKRFTCELGEDTYLEKFHKSIRLSVRSHDSRVDFRFFRFHMDSWAYYIKKVHPQVLSFIRNGRSVADDIWTKQQHARGKRNVCNTTTTSSKSSTSTPTTERKSTVSRAPYHVEIEDGELWDNDNVSKGEDSISGQDLPEDCGVFVL